MDKQDNKKGKSSDYSDLPVGTDVAMISGDSTSCSRGFSMCTFEVMPSTTGDPMPTQKRTKVPNGSFMV